MTNSGGTADRHRPEQLRDTTGKHYWRPTDGLLHVDPDQTGTHLVGWLCNRMTGEDVCRRAADEGLDLLPLSSYRAAPGPEGVLLGFSEVGERSLRRGVKLLRRALSPGEPAEPRSRQPLTPGLSP
jgi:DNA-binding transcriptional MocR family regulator